MKLSASLPSLAMAALLAGCSGAPAPEEDTFPEAPFTTITSDEGAVTIEVRTAPTQPPTRGRVSVELTVTGGPTEDLDLEVLPWMPDMGHGASTTPIITPMGGGRYLVTGVNMFMPGRWELRTNISGPVTDRAVVPFQIP